MSSPNDVNEKNPGPAGVPALRTIYFYLTEGCNLACRHCWMGPRFDPAGDRYPTLAVESFETAIREAKPLGLASVKLTGGEPLLHPRFTQLLGIVQREGFRLTIETNGLLCTPEIAAEIAKSPNRFVSVSIDGADAATHEWVRGVPGSFEAARRAVKNLVATGTRPQIIFTVMRGNVGQMEAMVRLAEDLKADSVKFNVVQPTARGENLHEAQETLTIRELVELGQHVEQNIKPQAQVRVLMDFPRAFSPLHRIARKEGCGSCGIFSIIGVMASGHYALCGIGEQVPELVFGTVGTDPLETVWRENAVLNELRTGLPDRLEGVCGRCLMKQSCLGQCVAQNFYRNRSLFAPNWFCEQAEEAGLFPASRLVANPAPSSPPS
jgi:SynChlorMet cassette radical SAM/SPASM protein ScmF